MNKLAFVVALAFAAAPAYAQSGQTPPSPNAASGTAQPANSVPQGALTSNPSSPRDPLTTGSLNGAAQPGNNGTAASPSAAFQATVPKPEVK